MSQGDKVTFLILYSFNRLIIISSDGKQAILTVNNLPRPQGTGLGNAGNNGEKLKIVPIIYYHQVKGEKILFGNTFGNVHSHFQQNPP